MARGDRQVVYVAYKERCARCSREFTQVKGFETKACWPCLNAERIDFTVYGDLKVAP